MVIRAQQVMVPDAEVVLTQTSTIAVWMAPPVAPAPPATHARLRIGLVGEGRAAARALIDSIEAELLGRGVSLQTLEELAIGHRPLTQLEERERISRARALA
jgi:hypothetical protein